MNDESLSGESLIDDDFSRLLDEYDLAYKRNALEDFWGRNSVASDLKERIEQAHEGLRTLETFLVNRTNDETPVVQASNLFGALLNCPVQLDRFQVIREIGRGGFGIVYLANDPTLHRQVAIKIPRIETLGTDTLKNRFAKEAEIAASLDHLHIVPVFEVGTTIDGIYIVSLYCPGKNLAQWLQEHPLELSCNQIVELMINITDALAYCHDRGVLHRDIKPANVLLFPSSFGSLPFLPRLNDFGLAKVLESTLSETASSVMLGTPLYMAPEQACSKFDEVCPATDVYALGAMFFELLTGHPPFRGTGLAETLDQIRTELPVIPKKSQARVPHDLETICLKCLAKQPKARYNSAKELLSDLRAFQSGQPISARRLTSFERLERWAAKKSKIAASLLLIGVIGVLAGVLLLSAMSRNDSPIAENNANKINPSAKYAEYVQDLRKAASLIFIGKGDDAKQVLETYEDGTADEDLRDFGWHYLAGRSSLRKQVYEGLTGKTLCADISPDDKWIAGGDRAGNVCIWNAQSTELLKNFNYSQREVCAVEFSPDGKLLATTGQDSMVHLWDSSTWELLFTFAELNGTNTGLAWSPDNKLLASCNRHNRISIWNVEKRKRPTFLTPVNDVVRDVEWSNNGRMLAANIGGSVVIWNTDNWSVKKEYPIGEYTLHSLAFSHDSRRLVSVGHVRKLNLIDCKELGIASEVESNGHMQTINWSLYELEQGTMLANGKSDKPLPQSGASFSMDGRTFLVVSRDDSSWRYLFQLRSADDGRILTEFRWNQANDAVTNATATELYVATPDGVSIIDMANKTVDSNRFRTRRGITRLVLSPDGRTLATWVRDEGIYLWNVRTGEELFPVMITQAHIDQMRFTVDSLLQFRKNDHGILSFAIFRGSK